MLDEYAVEPEAIGASWSDFRYLIEKFGFDQGRLISRFPAQWLNMVLEVAKGLPDVERKRVTVGLERAKRCVIDTRRPYNPGLAGWLENAVTEHARVPFHAIIAKANPQNSGHVLTVGEIDDRPDPAATCHATSSDSRGVDGRRPCACRSLQAGGGHDRERTRA